MIVIGLTGGIAAGKSTISQLLAERGAAILDADKVGHEVYKPGTEGFRRVAGAFGDRVVGTDGEIDRKALGAIVFAEPAQRERLQSIVWPVMKEIMRDRLDALRSAGVDVAVLEAAVLLEAGWQDLVDHVWVVTVPEAMAEARLMTRNGLSSEQAKARIAAQLTNDERTKHASVVIDNSGTVEQAAHRVAALWDQVMAAGAR